MKDPIYDESEKEYNSQAIVVIVLILFGLLVFMLPACTSIISVKDDASNPEKYELIEFNNGLHIQNNNLNKIDPFLVKVFVNKEDSIKEINVSKSQVSKIELTQDDPYIVLSSGIEYGKLNKIELFVNKDDIEYLMRECNLNGIDVVYKDKETNMT